MELTGTVAFVTGGSGDIGGAICEALAEAGADIAVGYAGNLEAAEAASVRVRDAGRNAAEIRLDQRDPDSIADAGAHIRERFGRCDILVNNGAWNIGTSCPEDSPMLSGQLADAGYRTHLIGLVLGIIAAGCYFWVRKDVIRESEILEERESEFEFPAPHDDYLM